MTSAEMKLAVQQSVNYESSHDRHNCTPLRKPVLCIVCRLKPGPMCDTCKDAWREAKAA